MDIGYAKKTIMEQEQNPGYAKKSVTSYFAYVYN